MRKLKAYSKRIFLFTFILLLAAIYRVDADMENPFGVLEFLHWNHPWNSYKYSSRRDLEKAVALMKEAGVGWIRMDFLWEDIEPQEGEFDFQKYDAIVELLAENKINILGLLDYSAPWAASGGQWNNPPRDFKLFINYALKVAGRYKGKVKYWEVWNEPDSNIYWMPQDGLKTYCLLLRDTYTALKKQDPDCKILNGGLANGLISVNRLYENGAKEYFDILNVHFFASPLQDNAIKAVTAYPKLVYKAMLRNGDGQKKIWLTEIGCPGVKRTIQTGDWWLGKNPTEKEQAGWLKEVFTELLKDKNIEKVFWAFFRDCKRHWENGIDYFGLVHWDFSRKPAFFAYQESFLNYKKNR